MLEFAIQRGRRNDDRAMPATKSRAGRAPSSAGEALEAGVRREMEARLGADFASVRVHTDTEAGESARALNARAYTVGPDIVFGAGQYAPSTPIGRHVLAHELAHVVQQGPDAVPVRPGPGPAAAEREAHDVAHGKAAARRNPAAAGHIQRFDSFEHIQLGDTAFGGPGKYILLECHARDLPGHAKVSQDWPPEWIARYNSGTPDQKRAITQGLTYGEIMALAGDMYADIDPKTMATSVVGTMQRINRASLAEIYDLIPIIHSTDPDRYSTGDIEDATGGRYLTLAAHNVSHFSNVLDGRNNIDTWRAGHVAALALAAAGNANGAWAMNAVADHFLTDAFAAGHLRPDRGEQAKTTSGSIDSKLHHDLDNKYGVEVYNLRGDHWIAYGDDHLNDPPDDQRAAQKAFAASAPDAQAVFTALARGGPVPGAVLPPTPREPDGLRIAREAVAASKADIQAALNAAGQRRQLAQVPAHQGRFAAEELVPMIETMKWGVNRWGERELAAEFGGLARSELPGLVVPHGDSRARDWVARQPTAALVAMPLEEKLRMVNRMLSGWVSGDDWDGVERLYRASTPADKNVIRPVITPQFLSHGKGNELSTLLNGR